MIPSWSPGVTHFFVDLCEVQKLVEDRLKPIKEANQLWDYTKRITYISLIRLRFVSVFNYLRVKSTIIVQSANLKAPKNTTIKPVFRSSSLHQRGLSLYTRVIRHFNQL